MSFFRLTSSNDLSPQGSAFLSSPFDVKLDPFHMLDQTPHASVQSIPIIFPSPPDVPWGSDLSPVCSRQPLSRDTSFCTEESTEDCVSPKLEHQILDHIFDHPVCGTKQERSVMIPALQEQSSRSLSYFPGIQLKLGKERDTLIRPMITAVFRANREEFRAALLEAGLKYGELRMWKDAQLCTAIHVADAFRPGLWKIAADLHVRKCAKKAERSRRLAVRKAITKQ